MVCDTNGATLVLEQINDDLALPYGSTDTRYTAAAYASPDASQKSTCLVDERFAHR